MDSMPVKRFKFKFITYGAAAYAIGGKGEQDFFIKRVDVWTKGGGWNEVSELPSVSNGICAVADEGYGRIYVMGGYRTKSVFYLDVVHHTWHQVADMLTNFPNGACAVMNRRDGSRILYGVGMDGSSGSHAHFLNLNKLMENPEAARWGKFPGPVTEIRHSVIVSLTPYESYLVSQSV